MSVYLYPSSGPFGAQCQAVIEDQGLTLAPTPAGALLAIAPMLRRVLPRHEWSRPTLGTLIFHPSLLPRHRGPDAVKWALYGGDAFTGVTWFWCDDGLDTGDICEQELVAVPPGITPRQLYAEHLIPAGIRSLERVMAAVAVGAPLRRVPQAHSAATYEPAFPRAGAVTPWTPSDPMNGRKGDRD